VDINRSVSDVGGGSRRGRLAVLLIAVVTSLFLAATGQSWSLSSATDGSGALLPRNFVVSLSAVNQFFPEINQQASTGRDKTAVGNPKATRAVFFTNGDGSEKVTITVDRYRNLADAESAFQQAREASEAVPGFEPISIPTVGQQAFAGTVSMGGETHVGLGALDGKLIVGVTLAGFDATSDNIANLVALARAEDAAANAAAGCQCSWR
jgi:hypothetical protein